MAVSLQLRDTPAISGNNVSMGGGDLTVLGSFLAGMESQRVLYSSHGFEYTLREEEYFNSQRITAAGGTPPPPLKEDWTSGLERYTSFVDAVYADSFASTADDESRTQAQRRARALDADGRNAHLKKLKEQYPDAGIKDMDELLAATVQFGMKTAKQGGKVHGFAGGLAEFAGGIAPAFDPRVNPGTFGLNLLGGGGKSFITRVLTEAGLGGAVAAVDEFTGVRHNMQLFGLLPSWEQTAMNVGLGAAAPVALHSLGRGLRRLARGPEASPPPPKPETPPATIPDPALIPLDPPRALPITPAEREIMARYAPADAQRIAVDFDSVTRQMDTYGVQPEDIIPPAEPVGSAVRMKPFHAVDPDWLSRSVAPSPEQKLGKAGFGTLGDAARALDKAAFDQFDDLAAQLKQAQQVAKDAKAVNAEKALGKTTTLDRMIFAAQAALKAAKSVKEKAMLTARLQELVERREPVPQTIRAREPIDIDAMDKHVASLSGQLDRLKPNIERALARASEAWGLDRTQLQAVNEVIAKTKAGDAGPQPFNAIPRGGGQVKPSRTNGLPELRGETPKPGENFTEVVGRAQDAIDAQIPKQVEDFKASMKKALADLDKLAEARAAGKDTTELAKTIDTKLTGTNIDLKDVLGIEVDGVSMRQALDGLIDDDAALVQITRCSVG